MTSLPLTDKTSRKEQLSIASTVKRKNKPPISSRCSRSSKSWESKLYSIVYNRHHTSYHFDIDRRNHETPRQRYEILCPFFDAAFSTSISKSTKLTPRVDHNHCQISTVLAVATNCIMVAPLPVLGASMLRHRQIVPIERDDVTMWHSASGNSYSYVTSALSTRNDTCKA